MLTRYVFLLSALALAACTTVEGHERALFYSASSGMDPQPKPSGWYFHAPWNHYETYDMRWTSHVEQIHIHSKDGLHMDIDVAVVVRPKADELYALHMDGGPNFYDMLVKPAVFAATRDASARFGHLEIATQTHTVEEAIRESLDEHLKGQHIELAEVAIQHFDLPQDVENAATRKAAAAMLLAAKDVDLKLTQSDAAIDQERRKGALEAAGIERKLKSEQDLEQAKSNLAIEEEKAKAEKARVESEVEQARLRAEGEAHDTKVRAEADKARIAAQAQNLSPAYVKLQALDMLSKAVSNSNTRVYVMPVGKNGLPAYWSPFLNPFGNQLEEGGTASAGASDKPTQ